MRLLNVPYFSQMDNPGGAGWRECFSSSCAMLAAFYGKVGTDDAYGRVRRLHGDTTLVSAQVAALRSFGLSPVFNTRSTWARLTATLERGVPVAVAYLHKGPVEAPFGTGHWAVAIGADESHVVIHDPMGEPLLASGGFAPGKTGRSVRCSRRNFARRWSPEGEGHGWTLTAEAVKGR